MDQQYFTWFESLCIAVIILKTYICTVHVYVNTYKERSTTHCLKVSSSIKHTNYFASLGFINLLMCWLCCRPFISAAAVINRRVRAGRLSVLAKPIDMQQCQNDKIHKRIEHRKVYNTKGAPRFIYINI